MFFEPLAQSRARPRNRLLKALAAERLQQVVEGVDLEGLQRVLVVGRHEDRQRHGVAERGDDLEAVEIRHLQIEQHQVRHVAANGRDGFGAGAARGHDIDIGLVAQHLDQSLARHAPGPRRLTVRIHRHAWPRLLLVRAISGVRAERSSEPAP